MGHTESQRKLGLFQEIQHQRQEVFCVFSEATRLFQFGWSCKNRLLYLTVALRQKSLLGRYSASRWKSCIRLVGEPHAQVECQKNNGVKQLIEDLDFVPSNAHTSSQRASLFIFDDTDGVIKMTIKCRSPTMRHVSQTHRVDLDWLCGRINLDLGFHVKYVNTDQQVADILSNGSFSRERWSQLTHLFNIVTTFTH